MTKTKHKKKRKKKKQVNHCFYCGRPIAITEKACGECMCEDDCETY